jgi:hypothetical protein
MKLFTITTHCHINKVEREYKVAFPSEEELVRYFASKKDRLLAVSDGWKRAFAGCFEAFNEAEPSVKRKGKKNGIAQKPYDYKTDMTQNEF